MKPASQLPAKMAQVRVGEAYLLEDAADTVTVLQHIRDDACELVVIARHSGDHLLRIRIDQITHLSRPVFVDPYFWSFDIDGRAATRQDVGDLNLRSYRSFNIDASRRRLNLQR
jgi:hypothetical protein